MLTARSDFNKCRRHGEVVANEDTTKPRKVRHSPVARDSFAARGSSPYVPPNASFVQKDKVSSSSHHSGGPPPSVLRPQHASQPYREDSDDDAESGHIMGAWQPFPGPGPRSSYDRTSISTPHQHSNSGFSRIGGSRAHYDSPYAIRSGPVSVGTPMKTIYDDEELPTPTASIANVTRLPALMGSGLPTGAMLPHMRTKSQTTVIIGDVAALNATPVNAPTQEEHPSMVTKTNGGESNNSDPDQPQKRHWYNI
ncbi:hypothetical protein BDR06DRAFT_1008348 [Suillus hirtellus]|nr:hypothetical protein BDR06DRAFT_1008348 [Suillus hirtellus]